MKMNLLSCVTLTILLITARAAVTDGPNAELITSGRIPSALLADLRRRLIDVGGCNANVCFAIDGSGSISREAFINQTQFVQDIVSVIAVDQPVEVAAVQYATANSPITPLTVNIGNFNVLLENLAQTKGASFVVGGINYCFSQLFRRRGEANKIVLLGDGRSNIGSSAIARADLFRSVGGNVCVVGAGFTDDDELLAIAGGDPSLVFQVDSFLDTLALEFIIEDLVFGICNH